MLKLDKGRRAMPQSVKNGSAMELFMCFHAREGQVMQRAVAAAQRDQIEARNARL